MRRILCLAVTIAVGAGLTLATSPASARKSCWVDHYHSGSGDGKTKRKAKRAAIASWQGFTAWEYGDAWGKWRLAKDKSVSCSGSKGSYSCSISAIPCHRVKRR